MSEYIIEIPDYVPPFDPAARTASLGEEIVRCRDCKWCMAYRMSVYCDRFAHSLPNINPDGFCAWGRRDA